MNQEEQLLEELKKQYRNIAEKPFIVSVLGQTGVGKSTLINTLFNTDLETSSIKPCTKELKQIQAVNQKGFKLWFNDMPGLGESNESDKNYLEKYIEQIKLSDIILWAIHIDNRAVSFDLNSLQNIMKRLNLDEQKQFIHKLTFVLTKADMLYLPSWIYLLSKPDSGIFTISKELRDIFEEKCDYIQEAFIKPYSNLLENITFNDSDFSISITNFSFDKNNVIYNDIMSKSDMENLSEKYPQHLKIFQRLYENYRPVYCSSLFKFNLSKLLFAITNRISNEATIRLKNFLNFSMIDTVTLSQVRSLSNLVIFNPNTKQIMFDLNMTAL